MISNHYPIAEAKYGDNVNMPIVDINTKLQTHTLDGLSNILITHNKNKTTKIYEFIISFNFFTKISILQTQVCILDDDNKIVFDPVSPYRTKNNSNKYQFYCRLQSEEKLNRIQQQESYYKVTPVSEIMKLNVYKLLLEIRTASEIYKYTVPVLLHSKSILDDRNYSYTFMKDRKQDLKAYLNEIKKNESFCAEENKKKFTILPDFAYSTEIQLQASMVVKKRIHSTDLNREPKRRRLECEEIENDRNTDYGVAQLPKNDCGPNWIFPNEHSSDLNCFFQGDYLKLKFHSPFNALNKTNHYINNK